MSEELTDSKEGLIQSYHQGILRKIVFLAICLVGIVIVVGLLSLSVYDGASISEAFGYIWNHIIGTEYVLRSKEWWADYYIWNVAMVHVVVSICTGATLACCGTLMQSLMNNPLADPYSTGISSGASLGAMMSIILGVSIGSFAGNAGTVVNAFIGAMIPAIIIIVLSDRINMTPATLILLGTALSMFFSAFISFMMVTTEAETMQEAYLWMIGNFDNITWNSVPFMATAMIGGGILCLYLSNKLNIMSLGDATAQSLGIDVRKFRTLALVLMSLMTAAIVSFVGMIGFVGLVCPHIVRLVIGSDNKFVTPIAMCLGALIVLLADYLAFTVLGGVAIGVVIGAIGAPIFFIMIVRSRTQGKGAIY